MFLSKLLWSVWVLNDNWHSSVCKRDHTEESKQRKKSDRLTIMVKLVNVHGFGRTFFVAHVHLRNISFSTFKTKKWGNYLILNTDSEWIKFQTKRVTYQLLKYANFICLKQKEDFKQGGWKWLFLGVNVHNQGQFSNCTGVKNNLALIFFKLAANYSSTPGNSNKE